jgi:KDO2-lipid IV(A) lauroyltransferase
MDLRSTASDAAYAAGWSAVRRMPERAAYALFDRIADRLWSQHGKPVRQLERNLSRVVPDADEAQLRELSRAGMRSYFTYWCDAFRMPDWSRERLLGLPVVGEHYIVEALDAGNGAVFVGPHSGNYDYGAAYLAQKYGSLTTVMERLQPESLFQRFVDFRAERGLEVRGTGDVGLTELLMDRVQANRLIGLVGERDLSRRGVPVQFFGERATMPPGAAVVALRTQAPLLPVSFYYDGRQGCARVFPPVKLRRDLPQQEAVPLAVQAAADAMAIGIAEHPTDWHMLQKLWSADLDPARAPREG